MKKKNLLLLLGFFLILVYTPMDVVASDTKEVKVDILTTKLGGAGYVLSFALADIIKKTHPWLRMTGVETTGMAENLKTLAFDPQRRKNTVIYANAATIHQSKVADPPYKKPYTTLRLIALINPARLFWVTLNPDIKNIRDLVGKKVAIFPRGSSGIKIWQGMVQHGFGINPKEINWVNMPLGPGLNSLADGRLDVAWALSSAPPLNSPVPPLRKLMAQKRKVRFLGFSDEAAKAAREKTGYPVYVGLIPAGTLSPDQSDIFGQIQFLSWWADLEMDEKVVYEITKVIYDNVEKFAGYYALGKVMNKTSLARAVTEDLFHPGAVRLYREKGVKIGIQ